MAKHLIIDGNNISYMAYHKAVGLKKKEASDKLKNAARTAGLSKDDPEYIEMKNDIYSEMEGVLTSFIVYFFINILHKIIRDNKGYKVYFIWDGKKGSSWRREENADYKSNRSHKTDNYYKYYIEAFHIEEELMENYPLYNIKFDYVEADDVIYNLCLLLDGEKVVVSNDGDMIQLMQKFDDVNVWNPIKKKMVAPPPYDIVLYKAIKGDGSDNILGLRGYGDKKAQKAINEGLKGLDDAQLFMINENKKIIDFALNPNVEENNKKVSEVLKNYKIKFDIDRIKKQYLHLKFKQLLSTWDNIQKMFFSLEKTMNN